MANLVSGSFKSTNVNDGADARLLMLEASGNVIGFDTEGKAVPGQKVDIVAYIQNIEGSPVFTAIPYIGETAQTPITLKGSGNARYITGEEWNKDWNRLIVSVSLAGFTDSTTIAKVQDGSGKDGQNAIVGLLTNEAITLSADENGNIPDFSTATGEFQIYDGLTKVTGGVSFAISGQVGASGTINQNGVYNVTAMTADTATIEFKATYKGTEIVKKLSLAKSRKGQPGKNANLLYLSVSNNVIVFDANDVAFPNQRISIVAKLQNISGTATFKAIPYINATAQSEIALSGSGNDRYISGENWDKRWTSLLVTATIGGLSDQTTIYKISEVKGADGKNTIIGILTNESITISADANGNVPDFTKATGTFHIYDGIALVDPKNVTYTVQTQTGATATIGTNGVYRVTAMSADTATIVFKATYGGVERTKQLSIAKSKAGQKGEAGNGIKSTKTQYQRSADGQTPPTGTWLDEIPVVPPGEFLWTRVTQTFDDNTTSVSYSVSKMGEDGEKGKDSYVHTAYAWSADGTDRFTKVYPQVNMLENTKNPTATRTPRIKGSTPSGTDTLTFQNGVIHHERKTTHANGEMFYRFMSTADGNLATTDLIKGETYYFGLDLRAELAEGDYVTWRAQYKNPTSRWIDVDGWETRVSKIEGVTSEFKRFEKALTIPKDAVTLYFSYQVYPKSGIGVATGSVVEFKNAKFALKSATPYTPTPEEDYENAYPTYTGTYSDFNVEGSDNPKDYTWVRSMGNTGANGANGKDGVSVKTITTTYQAGTSGTTPPTGAWLPTPPTVAENQFLWTKIEISLDDGTKSTGYSVGKMGAQGQPGEKGDPGAPGTPGNGIKSSSVTYQVSTSGTTTPTGTWVSTPPTVPQGQYLWTRTILTFDNGQSVTAYAVSKAGIDGENGLNNDNMVFNSRFEKFNEWPQNSMGWLKTQFTQATQPETDKPTNNILKIGGDASSGSRYTFSRNIAVVPGTTIELSFDAKLSRLFTNKNIATIRMFDAEHANSSSQPDTVGGNSYINLFTDGTANAGAGVTEYDGKNTPIATANTWYRYKVRFLVPDNVTNVKMFFTVSDPNASSFLFVRDPQGVIYKDLNANTRNFALDSRFPSAKTIGATTTRRKNIQLSRPTKAGEKYTIALDYSLISGTLTSQIQVVLADKNEAGKGNILLNTSGNKNRLVGEITATGEADHLQIFHGVNGATTEATNYEFEKIMFNLGDKTFDYEQAPEDGFSTTNVWPNSSWNIGKGSWVFTDDQFEILEPETDKPESSILHGKPKNINFQQTYQIPHPRFVNAGDIVHVSFDYKEKNRTADTMLACIRIFPEKDTVNSSPNALMEKYITPSVLGWSLANITEWTKIDYVFRATVSGWLEILPYDNDATGNHESFYREIFVTNAGKLHGEWSPAQVDFATQIDGIPKVFVQASMPTDPSIKNGDQWWVQSGNKVTSIKVYGNGAWHDQAIDQAVLNIVQLNAVNINGSVVNGSQFINTFDIKDSDHSKMKGTTKIQDGFIMQDVENIGLDASGAETKKFLESHSRLSYGSFLSQSTFFDDQGNQTSNSSSNLTGGYLNLTLKDSSGTYNGTLNAKALTNMPWVNLVMDSAFETAESNPPQYKIIFNLDGTKTINFRGQVKLKSGTMSPGRAYQPFKTASGAHSLPAEIRPKSTIFAYAPVGVASGTTFGGQWAITSSGYFSLGVAQSNTTYAVLSPITYVID